MAAHPLAVFGPTNPASDPAAPRRVGSVIELRPEMEQRYRQLHADVWHSVLNRLHLSSVRNYSIYLGRLDGRTLLFSQFDYVGEDFAADMAAIAADPFTRDWWAHTDPCQQRLPGTPDGEQWLTLEPVFHAALATHLPLDQDDDHDHA